jgi:solute carrier family 25 oxoglutarate transporter 11
MSSTLSSFFCAGVSGCLTTCCVHPLDVIRIRMQLDSEGGATRVFRNPWHCATSIAKADGIQGVYAGISAGIFRQIGLYFI